jgi:hypothetical protein
MLNFLLLMLIPTLIAVGALFYFKGRVTLPEFFGQLAVTALVILAGFGIAYWGSTTDTEVWNGQVTNKESHHVSCEHSYDCNCYYTSETTCTGTGKNRTCTTTDVKHCSTCYEHSFDVSWAVHASTGETTDISRIDRQGLQMPSRWGAAFVGEPYASKHNFENYIRANPDSVLLGSKGDMKRWGNLIPKYPDGIYDYYYNNPVLNMGVPNVQLDAWNWLVRDINKVLGPKKQVHIIVILVPTNDRSYTLALKDAWLGGKKNDVDVVIGSADGNQIGFVDAMSWSTNKSMTVDLRNRVQDAGSLVSKDQIVRAIGLTVDQEFVRMRMRDMKWLMRSFQPSGTVMLILFFLTVLVSGGLAYWTITNDITEESPGY